MRAPVRLSISWLFICHLRVDPPITGLDHIEDDPQAFIEMQKRALHRVDGDFCCVSHAELMSSKYNTGFYCATCAEARAKSENAATIVGLMVIVLFIIGLLASAAVN